MFIQIHETLNQSVDLPLTCYVSWLVTHRSRDVTSPEWLNQSLPPVEIQLGLQKHSMELEARGGKLNLFEVTGYLFTGKP